MRLRCPHCQRLGTIRSSVALSPTITHHYLACSNYECGHTWRASTEADLTLSPSATPDPTVSLPLSTHIRRDVLSHQIRACATREHKPLHTPPVTRDLFSPVGLDGPS